ncbi:MAG TPA: hypothetical protein VG099_01265 [Gemmataceae bacterium]|nr:hypothetical protein [Gemmataceae bacterium]
MRRFIILAITLALVSTDTGAQEKPKSDTAKAAISRKKLKEKISYDCTDLALRDVCPELTEKAGVPVRIEPKSGISGNIKITYKGDDQPLEKVLAEMFKKNGLGFYVFSKQGHADDGAIWITNRPTERGYRAEDETGSTKTKDKSGDNKVASKEKNKDKSSAKDKGEVKDKKSGKDKADTADKSDDDPDKQEQDAARKLTFAKTLLDDGKTDRAKARLEEIVAKYAKTKAAEEAKELLKKLDK